MRDLHISDRRPLKILAPACSESYPSAVASLNSDYSKPLSWPALTEGKPFSPFRWPGLGISSSRYPHHWGRTKRFTKGIYRESFCCHTLDPMP